MRGNVLRKSLKYNILKRLVKQFVDQVKNFHQPLSHQRRFQFATIDFEARYATLWQGR